MEENLKEFKERLNREWAEEKLRPLLERADKEVKKSRAGDNEDVTIWNRGYVTAIETAMDALGIEP